MVVYSLGNIEKMEERFRAKFINSLSGFKSANLIGTQNKEKQTNLSIVSSVFHLGASPALLGFVSRPDSVERHTLENIRATSFFTVNHINQEIYEASHQTSARYERDISEFEACGLSDEYINNFFAPFVKESKLKMSCEFIREIPIEENGTVIVIAKIKSVHVSNDVISDDGHIDIEALGTVVVSGLDSYHVTDLLKRLPYAKP